MELLLDDVATWPDRAQEELVRSVAEIGKRHLGVYRLSEVERLAIQRGLQEMRDGELATDEDVAAAFDRYRA